LRFRPGPDQSNLGQENRATTGTISFLYEHIAKHLLPFLLSRIHSNNHEKILKFFY